MTMTLTIALWGAALGTITLAWNLWKWRQEGPRLAATVEAVSSLSRESAFAGLRLKLRNRGGKKTTVETIYLYRRQGWLEFGWPGILTRLLRKVPWQHNLGVSCPETVKLPAALDAGGLWEGWAPLESDDDEGKSRPLSGSILGPDIHELLRAGQLRYSIVCAHTSRRIRGRVSFEPLLISE